MTIKINGNQGLGPIRQNEGVKKTKAAQKTDAPKGSDKVAFSDVLKDVSRAREASGPEDAARAEKLESLKQQIAEGSYQPDLNKVAVSLLKFVAGSR